MLRLILGVIVLILLYRLYKSWQRKTETWSGPAASNIQKAPFANNEIAEAEFDVLVERKKS